MNPKKQIMEFLKGEHAIELRSDVRRVMDGMSTGTAMIVIEKHIDGQVTRDYEITALKNVGRYYLAKVSRLDGTLIKRLLVDKQTGIVRFV